MFDMFEVGDDMGQVPVQSHEANAAMLGHPPQQVPPQVE